MGDTKTLDDFALIPEPELRVAVLALIDTELRNEPELRNDTELLNDVELQNELELQNEPELRSAGVAVAISPDAPKGLMFDGLMETLVAQPVSLVIWQHRTSLSPNSYNPNKVAPPELELLIISIMEDGWTQPIVVQPDGSIVDGFHRYMVSQDSRLMERFGGWVPTVTVALDPTHRMMSTIRHNRARGTHGILPMAEIVRDVIRTVSKEEVQRRLGMEDEEVDRLVDRAGMPGQGKTGFGPSWVPTAEGKGKPR